LTGEEKTEETPEDLTNSSSKSFLNPPYYDVLWLLK
jgi:hypothetical protein